VLRALSGGAFHSGEALAGTLGVTRATVWNMVRRARAQGLVIQRVPGRGYRLPEPISWLDADAIRARQSRRGFIPEVVEHIDSTNAELLRRAQCGAPHGLALFAELQSAARGRRGRTWIAEPGGSLTFSVLWRGESGLAALGGISLAVGLALARALHEHGVALKWPNDLLHKHRKLAGVLVEAQGDMLGPVVAAIGIGLNLSLSEAARADIAQGVTDLARIGAGRPDRNALAAHLLDQLDEVLDVFQTHGFAPLAAEWNARHAYHRKPVRLLQASGGEVRGVVAGVSAHGSLLLEHDGCVREYHAGEISLRPL
jgi:BirA family biotin operon repressor/biotin-[acetyl-CoA-carboxylase] ligase